MRRVTGTGELISIMGATLAILFSGVFGCSSSPAGTSTRQGDGSVDRPASELPETGGTIIDALSSSEIRDAPQTPPPDGNTVPAADMGLVPDTVEATTLDAALHLDGAWMDASGESSGACIEQTPYPTRLPPEVMLVLDQSASMSDNRLWPFVVPAVLDLVRTTEMDIFWGLLFFPVAGPESCTIGSMPSADRVDVPLDLGNYTAIANKMPTVALGSGTPTDTAILQATRYLASRKTPNPKYILLATDGLPNCLGAKNGSSKLSEQTTTEAVSKAFQAGIPTFVVGAHSASTDAGLLALNSLAVAGGYPLPHLPCPPTVPAMYCEAPEYYAFHTETDQAKLTTAFRSMVEAIDTCRFQLPAVPPDPKRVALAITETDGTSVALVSKGIATPAGDWEYADTTWSRLHVLGPACDRLLGGGGAKLRAWYGCASPPITTVPTGFARDGGMADARSYGWPSDGGATYTPKTVPATGPKKQILIDVPSWLALKPDGIDILDAHLTQRGFTVVYARFASQSAGDAAAVFNRHFLDDNLTMPVDYAQFGLMILPGNSLAKTGTAMTSVPIPILSAQDTAVTMGMVTGPGFAEVHSTLSLVNPGHPMSAGFSDAVAVMDGNTSRVRIAVGTPAANAVVIATGWYSSLMTTPPQPSLFVFDKGVAIGTQVAPERRVHLFFDDPSAFPLLNAAGWSLLDAAVDWAMNL